MSSSSIVTSGTDCNIGLGVIDKSVLEQDVRLLYCARYGNAILVLKQIVAYDAFCRTTFPFLMNSFWATLWVRIVMYIVFANMSVCIYIENVFTASTLLVGWWGGRRGISFVKQLSVRMLVVVIWLERCSLTLTIWLVLQPRPSYVAAAKYRIVGLSCTS